MIDFPNIKASQPSRTPESEEADEPIPLCSTRRLQLILLVNSLTVLLTYITTRSAQPPNGHLFLPQPKSDKNYHHAYKSYAQTKSSNWRHKIRKNAKLSKLHCPHCQQQANENALTYPKPDQIRASTDTLTNSNESAKINRITMTTNQAKNSMKGIASEAKPTLAMLLRKLSAPKPTTGENGEAQRNNNNGEQTNGAEWMPVPTRNRNRINELEVPKTIPKGAPTYEGIKPASKYRMPISIRIAKPRGARGDFSIGRILQTMLLAFQEVHPPTQIAPYTKIGHNVHHLKDLPEAEGDLEHYIESPKPKRSEFTGRIHFITDIGINEFRRNDKLVNWLNKEQISIDRSDLRTTNPQQIGYILLSATAGDLLDTQKARFNSKMEPGCPPYQLTARWLNYGENVRTRIIGVSTDEGEEATVAEYLKAINNEEL